MHYVIVGASAAGISAAKNLKEVDKEAEITLVSKDEYIISRCMLHQYISGERTIERLNFSNPGDLFEAYQIKWIKGVEVLSIDPKEKYLTLSNGEVLSYDKVLLATGAASFIPPVEGLREAKQGVIGLRDLEDAIYIKEQVKQVKNVIVLGAGLVGIDAVCGMLDYDVTITLVEMGDRILPLQLDEYTADVYKKRFEENDVILKLGVAAKKVILDDKGKPKAFLLSTGEELPCEMIIVATGVRANVGFLKDSGIECDRFGLIINAYGQTNIKDVYGAGDITGRTPIWPMAVKQGIIAANNMAGNQIHLEDFFYNKNTMNFLGIATLSLGHANKPDDTYEEEVAIRGKDYKKIIHKNGKIHGVVLQGDLSYAGVLTQLVHFKIDISTIRKPILEIDYGDFFNIKENQEYTY